MKVLLAFLVGVALLTSGCITSPTQGEAETGGQIIPKPPGDYGDIVAKWTQKGEAYQALAAAFKVSATLLSREVIEHQVFLDAQKYNWTSEQFNQARQKALYEMQTSTTFLVSLYTEKDEDNNLDKKGTVWNIFLNVDGKRIVPDNFKRIYENRVVLLTRYPHLEVWSRNYYVKFPIATDDATRGEARFHIAGPVGQAVLHFNRN